MILGNVRLVYLADGQIANRVVEKAVDRIVAMRGIQPTGGYGMRAGSLPSSRHLQNESRVRIPRVVRCKH